MYACEAACASHKMTRTFHFVTEMTIVKSLISAVFAAGVFSGGMSD
jgi:hypothetical protein